MKNLIKKILKEYSEEQKILHIPSLKYFNNDWETLQRFLQLKGNPLFSVGGNLVLKNTPIESLGKLTSVGGYLDLENTPIESLGNLTSVGDGLSLYETPIKSLGNLTSVRGFLHLNNTPIESLGNLTSVGGSLYLVNTPISKKYTEEEIREMVNVEGNIFM
jgi:hypothetical protein